MKCSRARDRLMAYHDGEISSSAKRKMERHLEACEQCSRLLEKFALADRAAEGAGVPRLPGPEDRYWEDFTSRVLDRVEEDAATRIPLEEKEDRPLLRMPINRLVPAVSIALVVVVSAGVLMKIGRVAPVPEAPVTTLLMEEKPVEKALDLEGRPVEKGKDTGALDDADDASDVLKREEPGPGSRVPQKAVPTPEPSRLPVPEKEGVVPVFEDTGAAGKVVESRAPAEKEQAAEAGPPPPMVEKTEPAPKPVETLPVPPARFAAEKAPAPAMAAPPAAPAPQALPPAAVRDLAPVRPVGEEAAVVEVKPIPLPSAGEGGDTMLPGGSRSAVEEQAPGPAGDAPLSEPSPGAGERYAAPLSPPPGTEEARTAGTGRLSSLYREPGEQLAHARRLAEVRMYWESEQILKDLISQEPPTPVYEEASILMVEVLSRQNRAGEAQEFLDAAKRQFPASDLVQGYHLQSAPSGPTSPAPAQ